MYEYMKTRGFDYDSKKRKLTQLLKVSEWTSLSRYHLWFLIDGCRFIIEDIKSISLFTKHKRFNKFVRDFSNERIKAKLSGKKGHGTFCKTSLNVSYDYDGMNQMKYSINILKDRESSFIAQQCSRWKAQDQTP